MFTLQLSVPAGVTECNAVASAVNLLPNVTGVECVRIVSAHVIVVIMYSLGNYGVG